MSTALGQLAKHKRKAGHLNVKRARCIDRGEYASFAKLLKKYDARAI